ncbi:hypothetical protein HNR51_003726 [Methylorubrum thiocyanatum]|uniref:Uncharacterized protein n=1 Tax=Methylorubrum thiocyanatum TaxID=47958 RepID=A0AA40S4X5_9HYPH|nr:hypothetical protein [Methylorubrum thiocyanatum]GJE81760.1 hypothetical protein CJNNKLLH_3114 [Methylorubrum thiocyanatum]
MRLLPLLVVFALLATGLGYALAASPCMDDSSRCGNAPSRTVETPASTKVGAGAHHDPFVRSLQSSKSW